MSCQQYIDSLISFGINIFSAVVLSIVLYCLHRIRYWYYLARIFDKKTFGVYHKGDSDKQIRKVYCTVSANKISFKNVVTLTDVYEGEFIINPLTLKTGEGWQFHATYDGFNFPRVIIKDDEHFFIETNYVQLIDKNVREPNFKIEHQAFIWKIIR